MKKALNIFTIIGIMFLFTSCDGPETKEYNAIRDMYQKIQNLNEGYSYLKNFKISLETKIDTFINRYPTAKHNVELLSYKSNLPNLLFPKAVVKVSDKYKNFVELKFTGYTQYENKLKNLLNFINEIKTDFPNFTNAKLNQIHQKLRRINNNLIIEKREFENLTATYKKRYTTPQANNEISRINRFLSSYPNTINKDKLIYRIYDLEYLKFKNDSKTNPKTIEKLNRLIAKFKEYPDKMNPLCSSCMEEINNKIDYFESKRHEIFVSEYNNKMNELYAEMENYAYAKAQNRHNICGFASDSFRTIKDSYRDEDKTTFTYTYIFRMKGGILNCMGRFDTRVLVKAIIRGNENEGVSYYILETNLILDKKLRV